MENNNNNNTSNFEHERVIIIGAGLGGLTLAQGLKRAQIPFAVFERDANRDFRCQGYRIRINADGADALKRNLDPELFDLFERTCADIKLGATGINALDGSVTSSRMGADPSMITSRIANPQSLASPYTVDRATLRSLLLLGLEEHVFFGKEFQSYTITPAGVFAHFSDGTIEKATLLVAADGTRSRVRRQYLPHLRLVDTDTRAIYGKTPLTDELREKFTPDGLRGCITLITETRPDNTPLLLFLEPVRFLQDVATASNARLSSVQDYVYWVLGSNRSVFGVDDSDLFALSNEKVKQLSLDLTEGWSDKVRSLLELQDVSQCAAIRVLSTLPDIPAWLPSARITLIGDAVHPMSPTGGVGANTALSDAANLCQAIVQGGITPESVGRYEDQMRAYAKTSIEGSYAGGKKMFNQKPYEECEPVEL